MVRGRKVSVYREEGQLGLSRKWAAALLIVGCLLVSVGCRAGPGEVNIARQTDLVRATQLEILERSEGSQTAYVSRSTVTDRATIRKAVAALDRSLRLGPRAACLAQYRLLFRLDDGRAQEFAYFCQDGTSFLRGDQAFWRDAQVAPPPAFDELMKSLLVH